MSGTSFIPDPSWPTLLELAVKLWGEPTEWNHDRNEARFGGHGSKSILIKEQVWRDHEADQGGGWIALWHLAHPGQPIPPRRDGHTYTNGHDRQSASRPQTPKVAQPAAKPRVKPWEDVDEAHRYPYQSPTGELLLEVYRTRSGKPRFRQRAPDGLFKNGEPKWRWSVKHVADHDKLLYRLPALLKAGTQTIWICEGEKDCDNVTALGLIATCNIGGAGKWRAEYGRYFVRRNVVVLADNDPQSVDERTGEPRFHPDGRPVLVGQDHAEAVAASLHGTAASVRVLHLPGLPLKGDVSDWIAAGGTVEELERLGRDAPAWTPPPAPPEPEPAPKQGKEPPEPPLHPGDPGGGRGDDGRPVIACIAGELPRMARQAEASLIAADVPIYQRGMLVQPAGHEYRDADEKVTHSAILAEITAPALLKMMSEAAEYVKYNAKAEAWVTCDPPDKLVQIVLLDRAAWPFPHIRGVLTCPTLRRDGSLLAAPGYDPSSRYYLMFPSDLVLPEIPDRPTKADAEASLKRLDRLLDGYPFVGAASKSVALTMLMTQVLRAAMPVSPLLAVSAKAPGTGKSHLVDLASTIAIGRTCPAMGANSDKKETEKEIAMMLLSGVSGFTIDNVSSDIDLPLLNRATSQTSLTIRIFGTLGGVEVENAPVIFMTGNNLAIVDEQGRRSMRCDMDAGQANPERRDFEDDPIALVRADRGRFVADVLTISRAFHLSDEKVAPFKLGGFEAWSHFVREPLIWLGRADPADTMETTAADDPASQRLIAMLVGWWDRFGADALTLNQAITKVTGSGVAEDFADTLREHFPAKGGTGIDTTRLSYWLRKFAGRVMNGKRFTKDDMMGHAGAVKWKVEVVVVN